MKIPKENFLQNNVIHYVWNTNLIKKEFRIMMLHDATWAWRIFNIKKLFLYIMQKLKDKNSPIFFSKLCYSLCMECKFNFLKIRIFFDILEMWLSTFTAILLMTHLPSKTIYRYDIWRMQHMKHVTNDIKKHFGKQNFFKITIFFLYGIQIWLFRRKPSYFFINSVENRIFVKNLT